MKALVLLLALANAGAAQACAPAEAQAAYQEGLKYRNRAERALAVRRLEKAAACQVPAAMFTLSNMLAAGEGAPPDAAAARRYLEAAAALGYAPALQQLALTEPDPRQAERLMRQAAHALRHR